MGQTKNVFLVHVFAGSENELDPKAIMTETLYSHTPKHSQQNNGAG